VPEISTLITDIYALIKRKDGWFNDALAGSFATTMAGKLQEQLGERQKTSTLRLSKMGPSCPKALWYSIHHPELAEALPPWAEIKYSYGHIIEALAIVLSKAAGHEVSGEQDAIVLDGITGHRDCVIDGCIVDVKSSSSRGFNKFKDKTLAQDDSFGYLDQLDGYVLGSHSDPLVRTKDRGYLLAIDKTLGHMCLYEHEVSHDREEALKERIRVYKEIVGSPTAPACECGVTPDGSSGNLRLDLRASYSAYKHICFPELRTFLYAAGPVFLSKVVKRPFNKDGPITEIDKNGKIVYNV